ncbi:MAG: DUF1415 domain-containing protein, partial [Bacteroidia bacterium]
LENNMIDQNIKIEQATYKWLQDVVIALNFCPFAHKPFIENAIKVKVDQSQNIKELLLHLKQEVEFLDNNSNIATTLIVYPTQFIDFDNYLDWAAYAEEQLVDLGYEGIYQLATFHPNYIFEGSSDDQASNYTNRSPYPMLHLIREADVENASTKHPNIEKIPTTNINRANSLGLEKMRALFNACLNL